MDDQALIRALQAGERAALRRTMEVYAGYTSAVLATPCGGRPAGRTLRSCCPTCSCPCGGAGRGWTRTNP